MTGPQQLLLVGTGSRSVHTLPAWVDWLRDDRPELELTVVLTRSAERFTTIAAMCGREDVPVHRDEWPDGDGTAWHVRWTEWADAIVVYPATLNFLARLALGLADTPALLAAQCTSAPVVLAPALPPGGLQSAAYQRHHEELTARPNVVVVPPVAGPSVTTGRADGWISPPLTEVLDAAAAHHALLAHGTRTGCAHPAPVVTLAEGTA